MGKILVILVALTFTGTFSNARSTLPRNSKNSMDACIDSMPKILNCTSSDDSQNISVKVYPHWGPSAQLVPILSETEAGQKLTALRYGFNAIYRKFEIMDAKIIKGYEQYPSVVIECENGQVGSLEYQHNIDGEVTSYPLNCKAAD